jgi:hypothetical protein
MTSTRTKFLVISLAGALAIGSMGCGFIRSAKNVADNAGTLGDLSKKLDNADKLTYQAEYKLDDGSKVTVAQEPPNSAAVGPTGRYIATADEFIFCDTEDSKLVCQKTPNQGGDTTATGADAAFISGVGTGFINAPLALAVLTAAILIPSAKVDKSTQKIAGQNSTCAKVSNLEAAQKDEPADQRLQDFTVCITDSGILSRFTGTEGGKKSGVELTSYSTKVDKSLFQVPDGATVTDLGALPSDLPSDLLNPTDTPTDTGTDTPSPSDSPTQ